MENEDPEPAKPQEKPEPGVWERFDIAAKALVAVAGFFLSAVLGYGDVQTKAHNDELARAELKRETDNDLKTEFHAFYDLARSEKKAGDPLAKSDLDLASVDAQLLDKDGDEVYLDAIVVLGKAQSGSQSGAQPDSKASSLQAEEAAAGKDGPVQTDAWFAVLGSYPNSAAGHALATQALAQANERGLDCPEIWKTVVSNNFALVYGGRVSRSVALFKTEAARQTGFYSDAFAQADRGWVPVDQCPANSSPGPTYNVYVATTSTGNEADSMVKKYNSQFQKDPQFSDLFNSTGIPGVAFRCVAAQPGKEYGVAVAVEVQLDEAKKALSLIKSYKLQGSIEGTGKSWKPEDSTTWIGLGQPYCD